MNRLLFCFLCLTFTLSAQNNWTNNPDINYLLEIESDFSLEEVIATGKDQPIMDWERIAINTQAECEQQGALSTRFSLLLQEKIEAKDWKAVSKYKQEPIGIKTALSYFFSIDTIITYDPETYEEKIQIVRYDRTLEYIRLKIQLAWSAKQQQMLVSVVGFYPLGEQQGVLRPLYYIELPDTQRLKVFPKKENEWAWIGRSRILFSWQDAKLLKGSSISNFLEDIFIQKALHEVAFPVYDYRCDTEAIATDLLPDFINSVDTIMTFDPETYEEHITIIHNHAEAQRLPKVRLYLQSYFSMDWEEFYFKPTFLCPLLEEKDVDGSVRFNRPYYYIKL